MLFLLNFWSVFVFEVTKKVDFLFFCKVAFMKYMWGEVDCNFEDSIIVVIRFLRNFILITLDAFNNMVSVIYGTFSLYLSVIYQQCFGISLLYTKLMKWDWITIGKYLPSTKLDGSELIIWASSSGI